jgi:hypothetical protein
MSFVDDLYTRLSGYTGLSAYVGDKIYPANNVAQSVVDPYIAHFKVHREKIYTHNGYSGTSIYSIQLSVFAATKDQSELIAAQVVAAMEGWPAADKNKIGFVFQEGEGDGWDQDRLLYFVDLDFSIFYQD